MMRLKRFLLFVHERWDPSGGWGDYKGSFATGQEAREAGEATPRDQGAIPCDYTYHVVDLSTSKIIYASDEPVKGVSNGEADG